MPLVAKVERHALGLQQSLVLAGQAGVGTGEDAGEVVHRQRIELDLIGKRPCISGIRSDGFDR